MDYSFVDYIAISALITSPVGLVMWIMAWIHDKSEEDND